MFYTDAAVFSHPFSLNVYMFSTLPFSDPFPIPGLVTWFRPVSYNIRKSHIIFELET